MYTYEVSNNKAIIYKDGVEFDIVGPWHPDNPSGPATWAEQWCIAANAPAPEPEATPE